MTAKQILEMIEAVYPSDTAKLDEIDAMVWCYLNSAEFKWTKGRGLFEYNIGGKENVTKRIGKNIQYTRSRDALKQIRPDGKIMWCFFENYPEGARARAEIFHDHGDNPIQTGWFPTEELAELHAIIQAIEYERTNK